MSPTGKLVLGSSLSFLILAILISAFLPNLLEPCIPPSFKTSRTSHEPESSVSVHILTLSPLLLSIHNFLTPHEIAHLLRLGDPLFARSLVKDGTVSPARTSESCFLPGNDSVVAGVKHRAERFMGGMAYDGLEAVQLVRYAPGQKVNLHYDWAQKPKVDRAGRDYNRLASFFVYLVDECSGGETWFPNVTVAKGFGEIYGLTLESRSGISVRPKAGSGLFWINLKEDGSGDRETLHAGLPVGEGVKVGMNIWVKKLL